jgi:hypothetical protein
MEHGKRTLYPDESLSAHSHPAKFKSTGSKSTGSKSTGSKSTGSKSTGSKSKLGLYLGISVGTGIFIVLSIVLLCKIVKHK